MMEWTDRHCRYFHRLLTARALLHTEMVTADAVIHGDRARLLGFDPAEHPVALQLGGSEPADLALAARIGADLGYDEINLNIGCPSDRVQNGRFGACLMAEPARVAEGFGYREVNLNVGCPSDRVRSGRFGACLMAEPELVAACVSAMRVAVSVPVTVKCRIGIDNQDGEEALDAFVDTVAAVGCEIFVVHARKAWLDGLSPRENRDVPPLDHARVHRLKARREDLLIVLNGGIAGLDEAEAHLAHVDGVMLGRAAYQSPWRLAEVDRRIFGDETPAPEAVEVVERMIPYIERELARGTRLHRIARHMVGLFQGVPGARAWRRILSEQGVRPGAGPEVLHAALAAVAPRALVAAAE